MAPGLSVTLVSALRGLYVEARLSVEQEFCICSVLFAD